MVPLSLSLGFSEADIGRREDALACSCAGIRLTLPKADFQLAGASLSHLGLSFLPWRGRQLPALDFITGVHAFVYLPAAALLQAEIPGGWGSRRGFWVGPLGLTPPSLPTPLYSPSASPPGASGLCMSSKLLLGFAGSILMSKLVGL